MSPDVLGVDLLGLAAIAWVLWYFFLSRRAAAGEAEAKGDVQEIRVLVKGGYVPELITAKPGLPLRIRFDRQEESPCSEEVVFPDFGVRQRLPAFATTVVELPARPAGRYGFACGMDMLHGTLMLGDRDAAVAPPPPPVAAAERHVDPVCGMSVDPARAAGTSQRDGRTFYFCGRGCKERFDARGNERA